jgi:type IV pilus assembly protein PilW
MKSCRASRQPVRAQRGFTLVELMVTVAIALFLIGGLLVTLQNVRGAYNNEQALSQLQDQQRFALTVLADVIQSGGYFPDPVTWQPTSSLPATGNYAAGQAFWGTHPGGTAADTIGIRYRTAGGDQVILCDGSTNTAAVGTTQVYVNAFTVVQAAGNTPAQLQCTLTDGNSGANIDGPVTLVNGVQSMQIYYGVKRNPVPADYNVDTYLTADQMNVGNGDWNNISSVRVILTFTNPLYRGTADQPQFIQFERVIEVMARAGFHS